MKSTQSFNSAAHRYTDALRQSVSEWLQGKGKLTLLAQQKILAQQLPKIVGDAALQVSVGQPIKLLQGAKMQQQWVVSRAPGGDAQVDPCYLPFSNRSLDLILLHHSLDFENDPHQVLHRAVSALTAGGTLIVIGFNPFSLCGVARFWKARSEPAPWQGRFIRSRKVAEWLQVLNCEVTYKESACYAGPNTLGTGLWQQLGARFWPQYGAFYVLVARKRTAMIRPLRDNTKQGEAAPNMIGVSLARTASTTQQKDLNK